MNPLPDHVDSAAFQVDRAHPWPGLSAFTEDSQGYFFGRAGELDELFRRVRREPLTILFGQSGLGKTSLLQAGLFPRLRQEHMVPVPVRLDYDDKAPILADQVRSAIAQAIAEAKLAETTLPSPEESLSPDESLWEHIHRVETLWEYFHRVDFRLTCPDGKPGRLVLILDPFEEIFTFGQAAAARNRSAAFVEELADLVENRVPASLKRRFKENPDLAEKFDFEACDFRVLICLREDFLADLEGLRPRLPALADNRMRLTRMNGLQALDAVLRPGGQLISTAVAEQIVGFIRDKETADAQADDQDPAHWKVEPWLLSLVCFELNNRRGPGQYITAELVAASSENILESFYQRCLGRLPPQQRSQVQDFIEERLLSKLGQRENLTLEGARAELKSCGIPATVIDQLVKDRLLQVEERLGVKRIELTHDRLAGVLLKSRAERPVRAAQEKNRRYFIRLGAGTGVLLVLAVLFYALWQNAQRAEDHAIMEAVNRKKSEDNLLRFFDNFPFETEENIRRGLDALKKVPNTVNDQKLLEWEARLLRQYGTFFLKKGKWAQAEEKYAQALQLDWEAARRPGLAPEEKMRSLQTLASSYGILAQAQFEQNKVTGAIESQKQSMSIYLQIYDRFPGRESFAGLEDARRRWLGLLAARNLENGNFAEEISIPVNLQPIDPHDKKQQFPSRTFSALLQENITYELSLAAQVSTRHLFFIRLEDSRGKEVARSAAIDLPGTDWVGREMFANYGSLRFRFRANGKVIRIDGQRETPGSFQQQDAQVSLRFANSGYRGTIQGPTLSGTVNDNAKWDFSLDLEHLDGERLQMSPEAKILYAPAQTGMHKIIVVSAATGGECVLTVQKAARCGNLVLSSPPEIRRAAASLRVLIAEKKWEEVAGAIQVLLQANPDAVIVSPGKEKGLSHGSGAVALAQRLLAELPVDGQSAFRKWFYQGKWPEVERDLKAEKLPKNRDGLALIAARYPLTNFAARALQELEKSRDKPGPLAVPDRLPDLKAPLWERNTILDKAEFEEERGKEVKAWIDQFLAAKRDRPLIPGFIPLATKDLILCRDYFGISAVALHDKKFAPQDSIKAGEIFFRSFPFARSLGGLSLHSGLWPELETRLRTLLIAGQSSAILENQSVGTMTADKDMVYAVDDAAVPRRDAMLMELLRNPKAQRLWGGNSLYAFALSTGKLHWRLGELDVLQHANEFYPSHFLGAPLPWEGRLFVLNEKNDSLRLLLLDPGNITPGFAPQFQMQALGRISANQVGHVVDNLRRFNPVHLKAAQDVLVCPTNAGAILGVDLLTRNVLWAYGYNEDEDRPSYQSRYWKACSPFLHDGKVVFTAPEDANVNCLNLRDGRPLWRVRRGDDDVYLAGVFGDKVLVVGKTGCRALALKNGKQVWKLDTGIPSGLGAGNADTYFLPLSNGATSKRPEVCAIDLAQGRIRARVELPEGQIGNLVFHDNVVISQTATTIAVYPQAKKRAE